MSKNGIAWLPTKEARQIAKLDLAAEKRGQSYDRDLLPTKYVDNDVVNNPNIGGLQPKRPWTNGPLSTQNDFGFTGDQNSWVINGGFNAGSTFSSPPPSNPAYTYPDNSYTGKTYNFTGTQWMSSMNLQVGGSWTTTAATIDFWFYPTANNVQLMSESNNPDVTSGYHYSMLEIDSSGYVHARFYNGTYPTSAIVSQSPVELNTWNHIWFQETATGQHNFTLNNEATTGNLTYTRVPPATAEYFLIGLADTTKMTATGRFQGKIGYLNIHDYAVASTWTDTNARFRPIPIPSSLIFDGSSQSIEVTGTTSDWAMSTTWTIEFWSKATSASGSGPNTVMSQDIGNGAIDIHYLSGSLTVNNDRVLCTEPTAGEWTHVALVCDGGNGLTVYYNGTSVYTGSAYGLSNSSATLVIGKRAQNNFQYFNGKLTGIRITNTAVYTGAFDPYTVARIPTKIVGTRLLMNPTNITIFDDLSDSNHSFGQGQTGINNDYPPHRFIARKYGVNTGYASNQGGNEISVLIADYPDIVNVPSGATVTWGGNTPGTITVSSPYTQGAIRRFGVSTLSFTTWGNDVLTFTW